MDSSALVPGTRVRGGGHRTLEYDGRGGGKEEHIGVTYIAPRAMGRVWTA